MHEPSTSQTSVSRRSARSYRLQLEVICNNSTLALFSTDERQQCSYMNPAAETLTGFTLAEVQGRALHDVIHHTRPDGSHYPLSECPIDRAFPENNQTQGEEIFVHKDGHFYTVAYTASPVRDSGGITGTIIEVRDITRERAAEKAQLAQAALREGENLLRFVMDSMPQKIFTATVDGDVDYFNPQWVEFTGLSFEQIRDWGWTQFIHPDDVAENVRIWQQSIATGIPFELEHRFRRADGEYRWHLSRAEPVRTEAGQISMWLGSNTDITELKLAEVALRESETRFRRAITAAPIPLLIHDEDDLVLHMSQGWTRYSGYTANEIRTIGDWTQLAYGARQASVKEHIDSLFDADDTVANGEWQVTAKDGSIHCWDFFTTPIGKTSSGRRLLLSTAVDLTQQKLAEAEARQLNVGLEQRVQDRTAELLAASEELEAFSYSVSHDLRAPLRGIDGFSQILIQRHAQELSEEAKEFLQRVRAGTQHMGALIDELLTFSRLGQQPIKRQRVKPGALVRRCLDELREGQEQQAMEFSAGDLPSCQADPALLKQVWFNLLSNALKYTRTRDVARIEVGYHDNDGEPAYFVKDNGVGFDMRYADQLFGVFQRLHRAEDYEGTGVGLAIVQRIVRRHGGRVWAEAEPDQGATFYFTVTERGSS